MNAFFSVMCAMRRAHNAQRVFSVSHIHPSNPDKRQVFNDPRTQLMKYWSLTFEATYVGCPAIINLGRSS